MSVNSSLIALTYGLIISFKNMPRRFKLEMKLKVIIKVIGLLIFCYVGMHGTGKSGQDKIAVDNVNTY